MGTFPGRDGLKLAYRSIGQGRPIVLLHGFTGSGLQFLEHGLAATLAGHGYRVIVPDLRGHGDSARPHDPAAYPPDVLADDGLALIDFLELRDYDLGGYSPGGRIVLRMLARGARPARAIIGGQGLDALGGPTSRTGGYRRMLTATTRTLVVAGDQDERQAAGLAAVLPEGRYVQVPGDHATALLGPELGAAILAFLAQAPRG